MRHRQSRFRLRQKPSHSRAIVRNLVTSVLLYETVRTTKKRAEVVQPIVEKVITTAKKNVPRVAIRSINAIVMDKNACRKAMELLGPRYANRSSGYTRIVPLGNRSGDGAKLVTLQLVDAQTPSVEVTGKGVKKEKKTVFKKKQ